jgi:hypothetical protein
MGIISQIWNGGDDIGEREKRGGREQGQVMMVVSISCHDLAKVVADQSGKSKKKSWKEKNCSEWVS